MRRAVFAVALLVGCSWSNSLYQAHSLSGEAARAERGGRPAEADGLWSQAAVKAESALARTPGGSRGAEARWLLGRALARTRDCDRGRSFLETSFADAPHAKWSEALQLELARCVETLDTLRAATLFGALHDSRDASTRREAREHAGRDLVATGQADAALKMLTGLDSPSARLDRAVALAMLNRGDEAFAEVQPLLEASDASTEWDRFIVALAAESGDAVDRLLVSLAAMPTQSPQELNNWRLAALRGTRVEDQGAFYRRLNLLQSGKPGVALTRGKVIAAERELSRVSDRARLLRLRDSLAHATAPSGDLVATQRWNRLRTLIDRVAGDSAAMVDGAAQGDLLQFAIGELARDSLQAPRLAAAAFARIEQGWANSPYLPKSLFARIYLEPDSADALRARAARFPSSPYLAYLRGMDDINYRRLEDSLATFMRSFAAKAVQASSVENN